MEDLYIDEKRRRDNIELVAHKMAWLERGKVKQRSRKGNIMSVPKSAFEIEIEQGRQDAMRKAIERDEESIAIVKGWGVKAWVTTYNGEYKIIIRRDG